MVSEMSKYIRGMVISDKKPKTVLEARRHWKKTGYSEVQDGQKEDLSTIMEKSL